MGGVRRGVGLVVALAALALGGCSLFGVTPPPETAPRTAAELACTETVGYPLIDTVAAVAIGTLAGYVSYQIDEDDHACQSNGGTDCPTSTDNTIKGAVFGLSISLPWSVGATYGFIQTRRCRARIAR